MLVDKEFFVDTTRFPSWAGLRRRQRHRHSLPRRQRGSGCPASDGESDPRLTLGHGSHLASQMARRTCSSGVRWPPRPPSDVRHIQPSDASDGRKDALFWRQMAVRTSVWRGAHSAIWRARWPNRRAILASDGRPNLHLAWGTFSHLARQMAEQTRYFGIRWPPTSPSGVRHIRPSGARDGKESRRLT